MGGTSILGAVFEIQPVHPNKINREIPAIIRALNHAFRNQMQKGAALGSAWRLRVKVLKLRVNGTTIYYAYTPYVSPAWCVYGKRIIYAFYPQVLQAALEAMHEPHSSIMSNPRFVAGVRKLGGIEHVTSFNYQDLHRQVNDTYLRVLAMQRLVFGALDIMVTPSSGMLMPSLPNLKKEMTTSNAKTWMGKSGWHWLAMSPFPGSSIFSPLSPLGELSAPGISSDSFMIAALLPPLARAKDLANRAVSAANERAIIESAYLYAQSHQGQLPPNLSVLVAARYLAAKALTSPGSGESPADLSTLSPAQRKNPAVIGKLLMGHFSYAYFGSGFNTSLNRAYDVAAIFDFAELHNKHGCNVGFLDGHVTWVPENQIAALVAAQNAYRKKHHLPLIP